MGVGYGKEHKENLVFDHFFQVNTLITNHIDDDRLLNKRYPI